MKKFEELTVKQRKLLKFFLTENGCGAVNAASLMRDNFSWQYLSDMLRTGFDRHVLSGVLGSLMEEGIINVEECAGYSRQDCYYVTEKFLETCDPEKLFTDYKEDKDETDCG